MHHFYVFFFNDTATTEIYTLSLHDALPISVNEQCAVALKCVTGVSRGLGGATQPKDLPRPRSRPLRGRAKLRAACRQDRKSTRLNSSHANISYAVFCLKKKKQLQLLVSSCF